MVVVMVMSVTEVVSSMNTAVIRNNMDQFRLILFLVTLQSYKNIFPGGIK